MSSLLEAPWKYFDSLWTNGYHAQFYRKRDQVLVFWLKNHEGEVYEAYYDTNGWRTCSADERLEIDIITEFYEGTKYQH